jgi:hypothetical protein
MKKKQGLLSATSRAKPTCYLGNLTEPSQTHLLYRQAYWAELLTNQASSRKYLQEQNLYLTAARSGQEDDDDNLHSLQIHTGVGVVDWVGGEAP